LAHRLTIRRATLIAAAAALLGLGAGAATPASSHAALGVACPDPTFQPFQPWSDGSSYAFASNGGFENGAYGWTLSGDARVVAGNEKFHVHNAADSHSLRLGAGSSATSPPMCIGLFSTKMRFFLANRSGADARLHVQAVYRGGFGQVLGLADAGTLSAGSEWQPSSRFVMLGGLAPLLTSSVSFRFTPVGANADWRIDDLYLDPLMHR
jgi:hypothetical protein